MMLCVWKPCWNTTLKNIHGKVPKSKDTLNLLGEELWNEDFKILHGQRYRIEGLIDVIPWETYGTIIFIVVSNSIVPLHHGSCNRSTKNMGGQT